MELILGIIPGTAMAGFVIAWVVSHHKRRWQRRMKLLPTSTIRDAVDGEIKLVGRVRLGKAPLLAPFSKRPCAAFRVRVIGTEKHDRLYFDDSQHQDFILDDGTGTAVINPIACLVLLEDAKWQSGMFTRPPDEVTEYLRSRGIATKGWVFRRARSCYEGVLEEGELVVVYGWARRVVDCDPSKVADYREVPTRIEVGAGEGKAMVVSDDPAFFPIAAT